jgi:hypothetical protein
MTDCIGCFSFCSCPPYHCPKSREQIIQKHLLLKREIKPHEIILGIWDGAAGVQHETKCWIDEFDQSKSHQQPHYPIPSGPDRFTQAKT